MKEVWRGVEEYSRYEVSNTGKVRDIKESRILTQCENGGYLCTNMYRDDGKKVLCKVHRLVAEAFLDNPEQEHKVGHYNNRHDNSVDNLYWKEKQIKLLKGWQPKTLFFRGKTYLYNEFASVCNISVGALRDRIDTGWSTSECYRNVRDFQGQGYVTDSHWFPYKHQLERHEIDQRKALVEKQRIERQAEKQRILDEKFVYKKYGVGLFENSPIVGIQDRKATKMYNVWNSMLSRCYNHKNISWPHYGAKGVKVCEEWHNFQTFAGWYINQYKEEHWHLDKDILSGDIKVYSPPTCIFVPPEINTYFALVTAGTNIPVKSKILAEKYKGRIDVRVYSKLLSIYDFSYKNTL